MLREINIYYKKLESYKFFSQNETSIRGAFQDLLNSYAVEKELTLVTEFPYDKNNIPDGTIKDKFRFDFGYWEAKDQKDNFDEEISKKLSKGYPKDNIIFENSQRAVLIQDGITVFDIDMQNGAKLQELLNQFFAYEKPEILEFHKAIEKFREDIPQIIKIINEKIDYSYNYNSKFKKIYNEFLYMCQSSIDKNISQNDIFEMLLQHILTEDIFRVVFDDLDFHQHNNIAKKLNELESVLMDREEKINLFSTIRYYYDVIKAHSLALRDYKEKQRFLNVLYENFYRAYNPKRADKLGIIYTPLEIVDFMIDSVDTLLYKHFDKLLSSKNVKILDPATGTGTFLTQIINYIPTHLLEDKFKNELFANEISILPYYIANLNLEYVYKQKVGHYKEFKNISFVDTLELNKFTKGQANLLKFSDENFERIKKQEEAEIDVIIGNPPYNANQQNENDNNKNKTYEEIDQRIKDTYVKNSSAQKTKVYDMYSRFYRWASDRIRDDGIIAFITNSSFIDSKTFDGFRKSVFSEFNEIYIIDLGGNVRKNERDGNVFNIMVGVAIMIMIKKPILGKCKIFYFKPDIIGKSEKLKFLRRTKFNSLIFDLLIPDKRNNWLNHTDNNWDKLLPMGTKDCKANKTENAIFKLFSNGVVTARDEWVYDFDKSNLEKKVKFFISEYNQNIKDIKHIKDFKENELHNLLYKDRKIKYTSELENYVKNQKALKFKSNRNYNSMYRPFIKKITYFDQIITHRRYQQHLIFPTSKSDNVIIAISGTSHVNPFHTFVINSIPSLDFLEKTQVFPLHIYKNDQKIENITEFGLNAFQTHYNDISITKNDIFNYCYGVLHDPKYRKKYEINLKQDLPRIPFYDNFKKFAEIGSQLMEIHINFETAKKYPLKIVETKTNKPNKPKLKLSNDRSEIYIDEETTLTNFPKEALEYKLGNRSAIEWVLDGYKEKKIQDPTVEKMFDNYKFSDYKDEVIDLIKKVTTVSIRTIELLEGLR